MILWLLPCAGSFAVLLVHPAWSRPIGTFVTAESLASDVAISVVDVVVTHPSQQKFVQGASATAGHAAARAEQQKVTEWKRIGEDAAQYDFVPFGVESYGRLGASAQSFLKELGEVAAAQGAISKAAFVRSAYREVSCALQRGLGLQYSRALFNIARASGRRFLPGLDVPVQVEGLV